MIFLDNKNKFLEEMSDNGKTHNKKLIVILGAAVIIGAVIVTIALGGVIFKKINGDKKLSPTVVYELTSQQATVAATDEGDGELDLELSGGTASVSDSVVGNTQSGSVTPWNAPAIKGLSSGALQKTTSFAHPMEPLSAVREAVCLII